MRAKDASFVTTAVSPAGFPPPTLPEVAFAGRSNVGKSSLLNTLVGRDGLARTSSTPGRTRALNWFRIGPPRGEAMHFVDLPGYGYAKVPHDMRKSWRPLVEAFAKRPTVRMFVLIIDIRRGPEQEEAELCEWLTEIQVPLLVVLTKADKLAKNRRFPEVAAAKRALDLSSPPLTFSSLDADGVDELWRALLAAI